MNYLIPANASRGKLIFGFFRGIDLAIFLVGFGITLILLLAFQNSLGELSAVFLVMLPVGIATLLVMPVPNQHNILVLLQIIWKFYNERRDFHWKGWCKDYGDESK